MHVSDSESRKQCLVIEGRLLHVRKSHGSGMDE